MPVSEIKPCPFCGVMPEIHPECWEKDGDNWGMVKCNNDLCPAMPDVSEYGSHAEGTGGQEASLQNKEAAIRLWNQRAA